jgi:hypothetical protein
MLPDLRDLLDVRIGGERLGEDQMMASADIPHGEARERSMDIVRARTDLSDRAKKDPR